MQPFRSTVTCGLLTLALGSVTSSAAGQSNLSAVVQAARKACDDGQLDVGIGTLEPIVKETGQMVPQLHLAMCYSMKGSWKKAIREADLVIDKANIARARPHNPNSTAAIEEILRWAKETSADLNTRAPKVRIIPTGARATADRLRILLDGEAVAPSQWQTIIPMDSGSHRIEPRLISEGVLPAVIVHARDMPGEGIEYPVYIHVPAAQDRYILSNNLQKYGIVAIVAGSAAVAASGVFFTLAVLNYRDSDASGDCPPYPPNAECVGDGLRLRESGYQYAQLGTGLLLGGAIAIPLGITSTFIGHRLEKSKIAEGTKISLFLTPWGAGVVGSF